MPMPAPRFAAAAALWLLSTAALAAVSVTPPSVTHAHPAAATVPATTAAPVASTANAAALAKSGVLLDRIVAVINDDVILESELDERVAQITKQLEARNTPLPPASILQKQVLDQMVMTKLELQEASARGLNVSDDTLNQTLNRIAQSNGITLDQLPAKLAAEGLDYAGFRKDLRTQIVIHDLEQQVVNDQMHITPREVQAQIQADQQNGDADSQYHLAQILITTPLNPSPEQVADARKKADEVYAKLKHGADFAAMAAEYSQGQQALKGGDLGWRKGSELPTIFTDAVRSMQPGDISPPIVSSSGFHIVKLMDVKRNNSGVMVTQTHARHILLRLGPLLNDAQAQAKLEELRKQILAGADFAKLAKEYSEDPGSANQGGDLGWIDPGATVPEFQAQMDKLQVGQISEPFKSQYGWHIVQVLGRRQKDQSQEYTQNKAYEAIFARKSDEILQQWLGQLKGSAFIEYHLEG